MSLRWKIAIAVGSLAALATLAVGGLGYRATQDRLYDEIDESLGVAAAELRAVAQGRGMPMGRGPAPFYEAQWLSADGSVLATTNVDWEPTAIALSVVGRPQVAVTQTSDIGPTTYRVRTVGLAGGAVQVGRPIGEVERVLHSLRTRTAIVVAVVAAAAALLGSLIAARVTATLRQLTVAADAVRATGRFDVNVPRDGNDEVSRLSVSFGSMLDSLERSRTEQRRLVEDAGHELRTPLTSVRTNLDVLRLHPDLAGEDRRQIVSDLHSEIEEMVDLVEELVTVAGGVAPDEAPSSFSLGDLARRVAGRFARRTGRTIDVTADESPVHAQPMAVERAVSNLIDNATKFDVSAATVSVSVCDGTVEVADRGPGIPADELASVFERFRRGASTQSMPGSGLGLAIVRDVVEHNGGIVTARAREGGGAVVGFRLPLTSEPLT